MVQSPKQPTGKARKGTVTVRPDSGSIKACFPRNYFDDGKQLKLGTGINPDDWQSTASKLQRRLQLELEDGKLDDGHGHFNVGRYQEILEEYGLRAKLRIVKGNATTTSDNQLPPKPELSLMEMWDMYCEYIKPRLRESHFVNHYQSRLKQFLQSAIEATNSEDALKIRNWLIENRNHRQGKELLSNLSKAYQMAIRNQLLTHNPFDGMAEEIVTHGAKGKVHDEVEIENDDDACSTDKAYTWDESQIILDYIGDNYPHWFNFVKFKLLTGCRTSEAIAFMYGDIEWERERILIRRTYDKRTKKFYPLKNDRSYRGEEERKFPMPKDGELWQFLRSMSHAEGNEIVFKSRAGRIIDLTTFGNAWRGRKDARNKGIIPKLIEQGKLTKYLPAYNTRHTFITHQIFDLGRDEKIVAKWCGHHIEVSNKHYQDVAIFAGKINPELPANSQQVNQQQSEIDMLKEQLKRQQETIDELRMIRDQESIKDSDNR